jgi:hypothetical protein
MQQTEFNRLVAASFAEFDKRLREARLRAARAEGVDGSHSGAAKPATAARPELRIEELVA